VDTDNGNDTGSDNAVDNEHLGTGRILWERPEVDVRKPDVSPRVSAASPTPGSSLACAYALPGAVAGTSLTGSRQRGSRWNRPTDPLYVSSSRSSAQPAPDQNFFFFWKFIIHEICTYGFFSVLKISKGYNS